jgi:lysozyme
VVYVYKHTIQDFTDHPAITGEWGGERLSDAMCRAAGLSPGCISTAAGRYQMIRKTWLDAKNTLGLTDFSPGSQDRAALWLIERQDALSDVQEGRISDAIAKVRRTWASFPASGWGQPERPLSNLLAAYTTAGGTLA